MTLQHIVLGMLFLPIYIDATKSSKGKSEHILEQGELELESRLYNSQNNNRDDNNLTKGRRQKRFYEYNGYDLSSTESLSYSSNSKRDQSPHTGTYGSVDSLTGIHKRIQEIANFVQQSAVSPPRSPQFPYYSPDIFKSQVDCICDHESKNTPLFPVPEKTQTIQFIRNTFPDVENESQHWGSVDKTGTNNDDGEDYSRPISFDPIKPDKPQIWPVPTVEHGSSQASAQGNTPRSIIRPYTSDNVGQSVELSVGTSSSMANEGPNKCDRVLLSCCHMLHVTYDCFESQGCSSFTSQGNPCEPKVLLRVIDKFQKFYGLRNR